MPTPLKSFTDEQKAEAIALVESCMPRKESAARIGCVAATLKGWLSWHRMQLARTLSDADLLAYLEEQWKRFTPTSNSCGSETSTSTART